MFPLVLSFCGIGCALLINITSADLLMWVLICPLFGAFWILLLAEKNVYAHRFVALIFSLITFLFSLLIWAQFIPNSSEPFQQIVGLSSNWKGTLWLRLEFGVDGLNLWMILLTTFLIPVAILCSWLSQKKIVNRL